MIVDGIVEAVDCQKFAAKLGVKLFVGESSFTVLFGRGEAVLSLLQNLLGSVQPVNATDSLGVHQQRGVPAPGCIQHDITQSLMRR